MYAFYGPVWAMYALAALGLVYMSWRLVRKAGNDIFRRTTVALIGSVLLTPWFVISEKADMAPAIVIAIFEGFLMGDGSAKRGLLPVVGVFLICLFLILGYGYLRKRSASPSTKEGSALGSEPVSEAILEKPSVSESTIQSVEDDVEQGHKPGATGASESNV